MAGEKVIPRVGGPAIERISRSMQRTRVEVYADGRWQSMHVLGQKIGEAKGAKVPMPAWYVELKKSNNQYKVIVHPGDLVKLPEGTEGGVTGTGTEKSIEANQIVYLEAEISNMAIGDIQVVVGEKWDGHPKPFKVEEDSSGVPRQTKAYRQLAVCQSESGSLKLYRCEAGNLTLQLGIVDKIIGYVFA
ncbi:MAG: hypothetical protein QM680_13695 [Luteolibacter sp.]